MGFFKWKLIAKFEDTEDINENATVQFYTTLK